MKFNLSHQVSYFGSIFKLLLMVICAFPEAGDEIDEEFESGLNVGVFFGHFLMVLEERVFGYLINLLQPGEVLLKVFH